MFKRTRARCVGAWHCAISGRNERTNAPSLHTCLHVQHTHHSGPVCVSMCVWLACKANVEQIFRENKNKSLARRSFARDKVHFKRIKTNKRRGHCPRTGRGLNCINYDYRHTVPARKTTQNWDVRETNTPVNISVSTLAGKCGNLFDAALCSRRICAFIYRFADDDDDTEMDQFILCASLRCCCCSFCPFVCRLHVCTPVSSGSNGSTSYFIPCTRLAVCGYIN